MIAKALPLLAMNLAGRLFVLAGILLLLATALACTPTEEGLNSEPWAAPLAPTTEAFPTLEPAADLPTVALAEAATPLPTAAMAAAATALPTAAPLMSSPESMVQTVPDAEAEEARRRYQRLLRAQWDTDFTRTTISFDEIMTGGPPKDGIPSIDDPQFESIDDADLWLDDLEPVQVVDLNGDVRAYPVQVMVWHELVNDTVGGEPVVITF